VDVDLANQLPLGRVRWALDVEVVIVLAVVRVVAVIRMVEGGCGRALGLLVEEAHLCWVETRRLGSVAC